MATKYKYLYSVHMWLNRTTLGLQIVKGDNSKQAKERYLKRFPNKKGKRKFYTIGRYHGSQSILTSSAI